MKKEIKSKKTFNEIIGLDNDFRNSIEKDINIYGVKHSIAKLIEFSSATANHSSLYSYSNIYNYYLVQYYKNKIKNKYFFYFF